MNQDELKSLKADKVVDARGMARPGPLLEAKKAITVVTVGGVMEVLSSDEGTNNDIPCGRKKCSTSSWAWSKTPVSGACSSSARSRVRVPALPADPP